MSLLRLLHRFLLLCPGIGLDLNAVKATLKLIERLLKGLDLCPGGGSSKASISARSDLASSTNLSATVLRPDIRQLRVPVACGKRTGVLQPLRWNAWGRVTLSTATLESGNAQNNNGSVRGILNRPG